MVIKGVVDNIIFRDPEGKTGYTIAKIVYDAIDRKDMDIVALGYFPSIAVGEFIKMTGEYVHNNIHGRQFKVLKHHKVVPTDSYKTAKLLSGGLFKGVGPFTAGRIVKMFGDQTMEVLESRSVKILDVSGVGMKTAELIWGALDSYKGKLDIIKWMVDYGFSNKMIQRITKWFKDSSITKLREDPYILTYIKGIGFPKADAFAKWVGISGNDPKRIKAGIYYTLINDDEGHTFMPQQKLQSMSSTLLGTVIDEKVYSDALLILVEDKKIKVEHWGVHAIDLFHCESIIADKMITLGQRRTLHDAKQEKKLNLITKEYEKRNKLKLNDMQRHAILRAAIEGISILTGGPGTGKTLTIGGIINYYRTNGMMIRLCAPTGRAAKRMTETIGHEASTIHRLLGFDPEEFGRFKHHEANPLDCDLLIVDETSMVDVRLMRSLLDAVDDTRTTVVLVGDEDQLPSIGPGNVLKDSIASDKIAFTRLTELYRQSASSLIVKNARIVNSGVNELDTGGRGKDFIWHNTVTPRMVVKVVSEFIPQVYGIDPLNTIVLSPIRKAAGDLNVNNLNIMLQEALNPHGTKIPSSKFDLRLNDRVVHNENDYVKEVFNGDVGTIVKIDPKSVTDKGIFYVDYYGRNVAYEITEAREIELARAISIHRSQGGEYEAVVIVLPESYIARKLLSRNLLYTAITRSRKLCILLGKESIVRQAIANNVVAKRNTRLKEWIDARFRRERHKNN